MARLLTALEVGLLEMDVDDWLDLEDCTCEGRCECGEQNDPD